MGYIAGVDREQQVLFPETLDEYVTADNAVRFIDAFVARLDLTALRFARTTPAQTGRPGYNPGDLLRLYLYGYMNRVRSSRALEREAQRNVEVMWLLGKRQPDHKTISDFRRDHPDALKDVYRQFMQLCRKMELLGGSRVAVDGSKFIASNAREKNQTQGGAKKALAEEEKRIARYMAELDAQDREDAKPESPEALQQKLSAALERKAGYEAVLAQMEKSGETQISLTDPESRRMQVRGGGTAVCYNVQIAVDEKHHLICAYEVTNEVSDIQQLSGMAVAAKEALEVEALEVLSDKGYYDGKEVAACVAANVTPMVPKTRSKQRHTGRYTNESFRYDAEKDVYHCPAKQTLGRCGSENVEGRRVQYYANAGACKGCPLRERCTERKDGRRIKRPVEAPLLEAMEQRLKENPGAWRQRMQLAEHPFGTIKRAMGQGYFLLRGLKKTRGEFALTALSYNLKRAIRVLGVERLLDELAEWEPKPLQGAQPA
jgi:transposase